MTSVPDSGTVRRVARPRNEIPTPQLEELVAAAEEYRATKTAHDAADARLRAAANAAYVAGGSHNVIAENAGIAKSTVQKYVTARRDQS